MRITEKALLVVIGVVGIGGLVAWFNARPEPSVATEGADGPCELPAGFRRSKKLVKWNPISAPGRCASSSASLVIDNGTDREIHLDLGDSGSSRHASSRTSGGWAPDRPRRRPSMTNM